MADCACNHFPASLGNVTFDASVGIGTATPAKPLDVGGSGGIRISQTADASATNEPYFQDNGQVRSLDDNHRLIFDRANNILELREFGDLVFSAGATTGARTHAVTVKSSGNVEIGTAAPGAKLVVAGIGTNQSGLITVADFSGTTPERVRLALGNTNLSSADRSTALAFYGYNAAGTALVNRFEVGTDRFLNGTSDFYFYDDVTATNRLYIGGDGNVGIGTTTLQQKLDVTGDAHVSGVLLVGQDVTLNGKINKSTGGALVDQGGCYYVS